MAVYNALNPIRKVAPYDATTGTVGTYVYVPIPSKYQYNLNDVSASDAGRTEDTIMHKLRISQKVTINLEFPPCSIATVSEILQAFNPEYLSIQYLDGLQGGFVTKIFYVGDRSSPLYNNSRDLWENITFNIIER